MSRHASKAKQEEQVWLIQLLHSKSNTGERSKITWWNTWWCCFKCEKLKTKYTHKPSRIPSYDWRVQTGTQWQGCNYHFYGGCVYACGHQTVVLSSCYPGYHVAQRQSTKHSVRNSVLKPDSAHERRAVLLSSSGSDQMIPR